MCDMILHFTLRVKCMYDNNDKAGQDLVKAFGICASGIGQINIKKGFV